MRETNIVVSCEKCGEEFRLFSDDNGMDMTICWNWCPKCGAKNNIWIRFLRDFELKDVPLGRSTPSTYAHEHRSHN